MVDPASAPIFVVGPGRSGTTLLQCMLRAHPRIYISHESAFYVANRLCPRRASGREFLDYYFQTWWFRWLRVSPERVVAGLPDPLPRKRVGVAFAAVMRESAAKYGRPRFGDKTPGHAACLAEIFADFPDARVIHVARDPRRTVQSLQGMPWTSPSIVFNALYLSEDRNQIAKFRHRMLEIRLEDLLAEPRSTMARVLDFVGEPWDDAVLDHARNQPEENDIPPMPWHEGATRDRSATSAPRDALTPVETRVVEALAWRAMKGSGYEPARLAHEPSRLAVWWAIACGIPASIRAVVFGIRFAWRMRRNPALLDAAENREMVRQLNPGAWEQVPELSGPPPAPHSALEPSPAAAPPEQLGARDSSTAHPTES